MERLRTADGLTRAVRLRPRDDSGGVRTVRSGKDRPGAPPAPPVPQGGADPCARIAAGLADRTLRVHSGFLLGVVNEEEKERVREEVAPPLRERVPGGPL